MTSSGQPFCHKIFLILLTLLKSFSLVFTHKKEINNSLSFLDVLVKKYNETFLTSVYRKPTFTGQYTCWDSFGSKKMKTNLIGTLVHIALEIWSPENLSCKVSKIKNILPQNSYPKEVIISRIKKKILNFQTSKRFGPGKCPVYLKLPWIENFSSNTKNKQSQQSTIVLNQCWQE